MTEEELKAKEEALKEREAQLNERENGLNEKEAEINEHKEDASTIVKQVKDEYEGKLLKQHDKYEAKLQERNNVIKQLLSGDSDANKPKPNVIIDKINARRTAQLKKW